MASPVNQKLNKWVIENSMPSPIQVVRTYCPFWQRTIYELWEGILPVVPANNYIRSNLILSDHTLADKAYSLILFFRFLRRNSLDFFELSSRSLDLFILQFRNELLFRVRQGEGDTNKQKNVQAGKGVEPISYLHARAVLAEVGSLCAWWGLIDVSSSRGGSRYGKSFTSHPQGIHKRALPECFQINIPQARKRFRENHVLELTEVEAIWLYLTSEARPTRPSLIVKYPTRPNNNWTPRQTESWKKAQRKHRIRLAWFHRQQMLWALLLGSGMRRSEVPLVMLVDVQFYGADLWVTLRLRKATEHLGRAKTGRRTIFIGWEHRITSAWQNWARNRQVLVDLWMAKTGKPDHGMFLTNRDGGPLTVEGMNSLFETLNARFHVFGGEFPEDQFKVHPHAIRHTVEALFADWGIPHETRQRHLGHKKPETTDLYGKVYRKTYIAFLSKLGTLHMAKMRGLSE